MRIGVVLVLLVLVVTPRGAAEPEAHFERPPVAVAGGALAAAECADPSCLGADVREARAEDPVRPDVRVAPCGRGPC